jgi:anhydro-N-acetylmuramic acid kinase
MDSPTYYIGIMTGTSMDAIDVVVANFEKGPKVISEYSSPISSDLRNTLMELATKKEIDTDLFVQTHFVLAREYAKAVKETLQKSNLSVNDIRVIGLHGQTIRHVPHQGATFQLGSGSALAALTGIDVVSDFRSADIALGGEGAPLVPMFDYHFLKRNDVNRIILNIGGIANLTFLPAQCKEEDVIAFDTGPGNMIVDALSSKYFRRPFDANGDIAKSGNIDIEFLSELLSNQYFNQKPPKSAGRELFGEKFLEAFNKNIGKNVLTVLDALRTATELSAVSIAEALNFLPQDILQKYPTEIIASGGGVKNIFLIEQIKDLLPGKKFIFSDEIGIPSQAKEALAFAWFAKAFLDNEYIHLPRTTGASKKNILGSFSKGN